MHNFKILFKTILKLEYKQINTPESNFQPKFQCKPNGQCKPKCQFIPKCKYNSKCQSKSNQQSSYVMTFNVIPGFFLTFSYAMRNNINNPIGPPKKLEQHRQTFSMLIFLGVENLVNVSHLRPSMLIFSMLVPHPLKSSMFRLGC